jgi:hypothetical protein
VAEDVFRLCIGFRLLVELFNCRHFLAGFWRLYPIAKNNQSSIDGKQKRGAAMADKPDPQSGQLIQ